MLCRMYRAFLLFQETLVGTDALPSSGCMRLFFLCILEGGWLWHCCCLAIAEEFAASLPEDTAADKLLIIILGSTGISRLFLGDLIRPFLLRVKPMRSGNECAWTQALLSFLVSLFFYFYYFKHTSGVGGGYHSHSTQLCLYCVYIYYSTVLLWRAFSDFIWEHE